MTSLVKNYCSEDALVGKLTQGDLVSTDKTHNFANLIEINELTVNPMSTALGAITNSSSSLYSLEAMNAAALSVSTVNLVIISGALVWIYRVIKSLNSLISAVET